MTKILVDHDALGQVLYALCGPGHLIRELQATMSVAPLMDTPHPISVLLEDFKRLEVPQELAPWKLLRSPCGDYLYVTHEQHPGSIHIKADIEGYVVDVWDDSLPEPSVVATLAAQYSDLRADPEEEELRTLTLRLPQSVAEFVAAKDPAEIVAALSKWQRQAPNFIEQGDHTPTMCECDNTHKANDTVCRWCWARGRRKWSDAYTDDQADEMNCAHEWNQTAGEADESGTRIYCLKCGADGDA